MRRLALVLPLLLPPGCAYLGQLGKEARETLHLGVTASLVPQAFAHGQAGPIGFAVGYEPHVVGVGSDYGYAFAWQQRAYGFLLPALLWRGGVEPDWVWADYAGDPYDESYLTTLFVLFPVPQRDFRSAEPHRVIDATKLEAGLHLVWIGASVGVDLLQVADLLTALVTWDLAGDDDFVPPPAPPSDALAPPPEPAQQDVLPRG